MGSVVSRFELRRSPRWWHRPKGVPAPTPVSEARDVSPNPPAGVHNLFTAGDETASIPSSERNIVYHSSRPRFGLLPLAAVGFTVYVFIRGLTAVFGSAAVLVLWLPLMLVGAKMVSAAIGTRRRHGADHQVSYGWRDGRYVTVERDHRTPGHWRPSSRWDHERSGPPAPPVDPDWERAKREAREEIEREFPDPQAS